MSSSRTLAEPNAARFSNTQDDVFGRIATRYDLLCDLFSLWILLAIARRRLALCAHEVELRQLDAHSMAAVPAASIDLCAISLGLKICNRTLVLAEVLRVLRPGGRIVVLEASNIPVRWLHGAYLSYMSACMPLVGWLATGGMPLLTAICSKAFVSFRRPNCWPRKCAKPGSWMFPSSACRSASSPFTSRASAEQHPLTLPASR